MTFLAIIGGITLLLLILAFGGELLSWIGGIFHIDD